MYQGSLVVPFPRRAGPRLSPDLFRSPLRLNEKVFFVFFSLSFIVSDVVITQNQTCRITSCQIEGISLEHCRLGGFQSFSYESAFGPDAIAPSVTTVLFRVFPAFLQSHPPQHRPSCAPDVENNSGAGAGARITAACVLSSVGGWVYGVRVGR